VNGRRRKLEALPVAAPSVPLITTNTIATAVFPRLFDTRGTANYLGVSTWTVRDWVAAGHLVPVELPPLRPREGDRRKPRLRRLLFDRVALDRFVDGLGGPRR
jgi:hypothetical protein